MNGNSSGEYLEESRRNNDDELIAHYKERLRCLLSYAEHLSTCAYFKWRIAEHLQSLYGTGYSAGPSPACSCGCAAVVAIIKSEVYDENGNPV